MSIVGDLFNAGGDFVKGFASFGLAGDLSKAAQFQKSINAFKDQQESRKVYMGIGTGQATIGASGLQQSGSAADVMRANVAQGALQKGLVHIQGIMDYNAIKSQEESANMAGIGDLISGAGALFGG